MHLYPAYGSYRFVYGRIYPIFTLNIVLVDENWRILPNIIDVMINHNCHPNWQLPKI